MALTTATILGTAALAGMYADARLLLRHDLMHGALAPLSSAAAKFTQERYTSNRMLHFHNLEFWASDPATANNEFLIFEGRVWTYGQFFAGVNRVANWLLAELGVERDEIVALDGGNSPEYLLLWFAIEAVGGVVAFVNCNLGQAPLLHCVGLCKARYMLTDRGIEGLVRPMEEELGSLGCQVVWYDAAMMAEVTDAVASKYGETTPSSLRDGLTPMSTSCLIYTSGTTGHPKGTIMLRARELNTARGISAYLGLQPGKSRMFTCLPMYHGAAHGLCVTPSIHAGSTVILSRKFSHATFWPEVRASKANILQYVGELCRYLMNSPPSKLDKQHNVEMAWGNGMRPDVWEAFRERFGIKAINELYAATDGMGSSFNKNCGPFGVNAIGKRGWLWKTINGKNEKRVRVDVDTEEFMRDAKTGWAVEAKVGEPGHVVHRVPEEMREMMFKGYYGNEQAGNKRWVKNLFEKDDLWFMSGDMQRIDADGCVYFVDRLGDTFRWKSENVSTNEVADVVGRWHQIAETNVVGVQVPNADGRCGLAAVVLKEGVTESNFDWSGLAGYFLGTLPRYAVPIFVRVVKDIDYTGTYKMQKGRLKREGVDLSQIEGNGEKPDSLYWLRPGSTSYEPFDRNRLNELKAGAVKL